jgi:hypothetical protein
LKFCSLRLAKLQKLFGKAAKALDAIDMMAACHKLIAAVFNTKVLSVTNVCQAVIATPSPTQGVPHCESQLPELRGPESPLAVWLFGNRAPSRCKGHHLGVNPSITFKQAKDWCLAISTTSSFAAHSTCSKVRFVHFNLTTCKRRRLLTNLSQALANFAEDDCNSFASQSGQDRYIRSRQILSKQAH